MLIPLPGLLTTPPPPLVGALLTLCIAVCLVAVVAWRLGRRSGLREEQQDLWEARRALAELKRTEQALRASEARWRTVFNAPADAIFVRPLSEEPAPLPFIEVNDAACELFGHTREEMLRLSPFELGAGMVEAELEDLNLRLQGGETVLFETTVRARDGRIIPVEMKSQAFVLDGVRYGLEVLRDVTDRKRVEAEVARLSQVVTQSPSPVMMTGRDADIVYVNPAFEQLTGYSAAEVIGRNPRLLQSGLHDEEHYRRMWETLLAGEVWRGELCNRRKNGELFWESAAIAPVRDDRGQVTYYVSITEDITHLKQVENELREAKAAAESANRAKSAFLANMSHEIRTPLNAILGYTQLLRRDVTLGEGIRDKLRIINRAGDHLLGLLNDVLEMAKIEAGRISIEPAAFDLHGLLDDLVSMFALRAEAKGLAFRVRRADGLPRHVVADARRLRQILVNICGNALKFTLHGHVEVRASVRIDEGGRPHLELAVEDTGIGIAEADRERLFRHFEQSRSGRKLESGTGLGLAISREYACLMGGDITVHSVEGQGSTFTVSVPVGATSNGPTESGSARHVVCLAPGQAPLRVLVVDDNESNRDWLLTLLSEVRFEVRSAEDGVAALRAWEEWDPHLVLMDLVMPEMDGYEASRRIKADPRGRDTVIIALTASALGGDAPRALACGVAEVLGKPFDVNDLFERIAHHLQVEFQYEDDVRARPEGHVEAARLRSLPPATVESVRRAVASGDQQWIERSLADLSEHDEEAGRFLQGLAHQYEYDRLLDLLASEEVQP